MRKNRLNLKNYIYFFIFLIVNLLVLNFYFNLMKAPGLEPGLSP